MDLRISSRLPINDVQKAFSSAFPYLKVEFFKSSRTEPGLNDNFSTKEHQNLQPDDSIEITGDMKVRELEQALELLYPLHAQVFRLSGNIWIETFMTNDWTLTHQNEQGREITLSTGKK